MDDGMIATQTIRERLLEFIAETFVFDKKSIDLETSLVQAGVIDSIGLIEITEFIERSYRISVGTADLNRENFGSVNRMVHYIVRRLSESVQQ